MARDRKDPVVLAGGPADGKSVFVSPGVDEWHDEDAPGGVYVKDENGVFRWQST